MIHTIKSLNLRSPYDTGKTKLIQKIITKFNRKKILWLSYRKTLTNDILGSFGEGFNFKDYQKQDYKADRLIIQLESITKDIYKTSCFFKVGTNDKRLLLQGTTKCYVSLQKSKDRCKYINNFVFNDNNTFWKVITSRGANGALY